MTGVPLGIDHSAISSRAIPSASGVITSRTPRRSCTSSRAGSRRTALALVYVSGFFEALGGAGLLVPRVRRAAAWGLVALYVAVFPANLNMAMNHISLDEAHPIPTPALWIRLPLQLVLIAWAWWFTRPDPEPVQR